MIVLVGLGNIGQEYAKTRHNIGFMAADRIIRRYNLPDFKSKFKGMISEGAIAGEKAIILKPSTFMNLSGESVLSLISFYKIPIDNIIVFHDDMDLPVGKIKIKQGGSAGGHNGLKSIDKHIGQNYWRVRIGVGRPVENNEVVNYVLGNFSKIEQEIIQNQLDYIADFLPLLLAHDMAQFMNKITLALR